MNIISSLVALAGIGYFCMELAKQPEECKREEWDRNHRYWQCMESVNQYKVGRRNCQFQVDFTVLWVG